MISLLCLLSSSALAAPLTFVKQYSNGAEIMQWAETNGQLTGAYQLVVAEDNFQKISTQNATFTGTRTGDTFTFKFSNSFLGFTETKVWTGTLSGQGLTLTRPRAAGFDRDVLTKSSPEAYNQMVAKVSAVVQKNREAAQQAARVQAEQEAKVREQTATVRKVNGAAAEALSQSLNLIDNLTDDVKALRQIPALFEKDLATLTKDHGKLLANAAKAKDCFDVSSVQGYDLSMLTGYDLGQITGYDTGQMQNAVSFSNYHLTSVEKRRGELQIAAQNYAQFKGKTPLSTVAWAVDVQALTQADSQLSQKAAEVMALQKEVEGVQKSTLDKANALIAEARAVAKNLTCK